MSRRGDCPTNEWSDRSNREMRRHGRRFSRRWAAVLLATAIVTACGAPTPTPTEAGGGTPVVIDTDLAADDLMALAFLLQRPDVRVLAVTVSGTGEVRCPAGVGIVRSLLEMSGHSEVSVACGRSTPLDGDHAFPTRWRDAVDTAYGLDLDIGGRARSGSTAVDLLIEAIGRADEPVTLLTLGPLTNPAEALDHSSDWKANVEQVVVMGGALDVPGNVGAFHEEASAAEWNFYVDPTAAERVMRSGIPVLIVPLDATNTVPVTEEFAGALAGIARPAPLTRMVIDLFELLPNLTEGGYSFWDQLAGAALTDENLVHVEDREVMVVTDGPEAGRLVTATDGTDVRVATWAHPTDFERTFLTTLAGEPPLTPEIRLTPGDGATVPQRFELSAVTAKLPIGTEEALVAAVDSPCLDDGVPVAPDALRLDARSRSVVLSLDPGPHTVCVQPSVDGTATGPRTTVTLELVYSPEAALYGALLSTEDLGEGWEGEQRKAEPSDTLKTWLCPEAVAEGPEDLVRPPEVVGRLVRVTEGAGQTFVSQALWLDVGAGGLEAIRHAFERCEGLPWVNADGDEIAVADVHPVQVGDDAVAFTLALDRLGIRIRGLAVRVDTVGCLVMGVELPLESGPPEHLTDQLWDAITDRAVEKLVSLAG